jgi:hypothetical protein
VKKISHTRSGGTGSLKLSVWATTKPGFFNKTGGSYYEMGSVIKKALQTGYSYSDVVNVTVTPMGSSLERGAWGRRDVPRYGQPTHDFETGRTRSCAQHG